MLVIAIILIAISIVFTVLSLIINNKMGIKSIIISILCMIIGITGIWYEIHLDYILPYKTSNNMLLTDTVGALRFETPVYLQTHYKDCSDFFIICSDNKYYKVYTSKFKSLTDH